MTYDPFSEYDFDLPQELIAQTPASKRDESRLLVFRKQAQETAHRRFSDIRDYLRDGDVLVVNNTKVIKARVLGQKSTGGKAEVFFLNPAENENQWFALLRASGKIRPGLTIHAGEARITVLGREDEHFRVEVSGDDPLSLMRLSGQTPLPPYILRPDGTTEEDESRYQTVYAQHDGAVAAPTAGLHFTPELLQSLQQQGVRLCPVTLHVGAGTFKPPTVEQFESKTLHEERYQISESAAQTLQDARRDGRRIVAVGTTSARVLESAARGPGLVAHEGSTKLFLSPGDPFLAVNALITNFHLPKSSLIMLVAALIGDAWRPLYTEAVQQKYRFYSFGDAMYLEP